MKHLKLILKTLISNNACVEAARTKETKYSVIAIVFALLAIFLAVLPNTINNFRKNGKDWMNSNIVYDLDTGIYDFSLKMKEVGIKFAIEKDEKGIGTLKIDQDKWDATFTDLKKQGTEILGPETDKIHPFIYTNQTGRAFDVYVNTNLSDTEFTKYSSYVLSNLNPVIKMRNEKTPDDQCFIYYTEKDGKKTKVDRSTTTILFGKHNVYAYMFKPGTPSPVSSVGGDYNHYETLDLIDACFVKGDAEHPYKIKETFDNWKTFFDRSYIDTRWRSAWTSTGIMAGVDAGVILFMGFMIWILTRGKNNPFRIYSFWDGQKIAYYASLTPGIIALILGFLLSQMAMMLFVLVCGVRIMWLSMRTLKPVGAGK